MPSSNESNPRKRARPRPATLPLGRAGAARSEDLLRVEDLENLHALRRVSLESVFGLLEQCRVRLLDRGEVLLEAGQTNRTLFMVLTGRLVVHLESRESDSIAEIVAGETVGEISVIDDRPASAHVIAAEPTRVLAVDEETFWRLIAASHAFAVNLLVLLAERMRESNAAIAVNQNLRRQFEREALVDALTGLHNRRWLEDNLSRTVERHHRVRQPMCVCMVDVDHFKRFNDDHGHAAGDQALAVVGRVLATKLRPTDLAARYGGEEFVVILPLTAAPGALVGAERLRAAVERTPVDAEGGRVLPPVTISLGLAELAGEETAEVLLGRADAALYAAKTNGRNRTEMAFEPTGAA